MAVDNLGGRLPLLSPSNLRSDGQSLYDHLTKGRLGSASPFTNRIGTGELIGPFNAMLHAPAIGAGFIDFHEAEEQATPLSARVREVVILSIGAVWASAYETYAHRAVAARVGFPPDVVSALATGELCDELGEEERAAQRFALELARNRCVSDATYAEAERVFGCKGLVPLAFLAAAYTATCVILNAFAVPAPLD